ncbi:hypothetical protein FSPOR_2411 [Fusarium sporotrichioides]|uniref:Uncharacterized protein n=1 Tax=Fusarium sporotrichioides TaxID=5514 RepID=A0A395SLT4_FUSSP|nr:hypothetical protein FSPOR_2411 [Fusarium sporotrichioides]
MPCCISIIQFQRCRHSLLLKLGCNNHCEELCPPEKQIALVITNYLWLCEDCHERKANIELDERCNKWADQMMEIPECDPLLRIQMEDTIRARENSEDLACEHVRIECLEDIQWVIEWTHEYGLILYDVLFKKTWEPRMAAERILELRGVRKWELLVVEDALRSSKVLFEEQSNETYWFFSDQFVEQRLPREQLQQPPARSRPQVPLFPWKGKEDERQSSESSDTLSSEELDGDGDVILTDSEDEQPRTEHHSATPSSPTERDGRSVTDDTKMGDSSELDHRETGRSTNWP